MPEDSLLPVKKRRSGRPSYGLYALKHAVNTIGNRAIDKRTITGRALAQWRKDLIQDLGGDENVSTQQSAIVDLAVKSKLLLASIDTWLLTQRSLINKKKKALIPVVQQRQALADGYAKYIAMLGLERRIREQTLEDVLRDAEANENGRRAAQKAPG
jgi:hypothetical protein